MEKQQLTRRQSLRIATVFCVWLFINPRIVNWFQFQGFHWFFSAILSGVVCGAVFFFALWIYVVCCKPKS